MNTKYVIKNAAVSPDDYNELREKSGIGNRKSKENAETAIENSLFITSIYYGDKLIAMARVVGDGAISLVVTDVMVDSEYQKNGLGRVLMNELTNTWTKIMMGMRILFCLRTLLMMHFTKNFISNNFLTRRVC